MTSPRILKKKFTNSEISHFVEVVLHHENILHIVANTFHAAVSIFQDDVHCACNNFWKTNLL